MLAAVGPTRLFVLAVAAVVISAVSPTSGAGEDIPFSIYLDTDAPGYDYKRGDPPSFSSCQDRCASDAVCQAFSYNVTKRVCFLKNKGNIARIPYSEAVTGRKIGSHQFSISKNQDAPGYDYERFDPLSSGDCQQLCAEEPECKAFSYNVPKQVCFLKTKTDIALIRHHEAITGIKAAKASAANESPPSSGTGFAVSAHGLILTNRHVIEGCKVIAVEGWGAGTLKAVDHSNDLALVKIEGNLSPVTFRATPVNIGDTVFVTGYPYGGLLGSGLHFTNGLVSSTSGIENDSRFLQFTAPVQPGNSGGPLLDERGQVAGVVSGRLNDIAVLKASGSLPQNVNFAIHGGLAMSFLRANDVEPLTASSSDVLSPPEIAKRAKLHTFRLNCLSGT
jgi:S1-C subfamily serine protease